MVEVVRQDQDEPGDVNLLLSPLTLVPLQVPVFFSPERDSHTCERPERVDLTVWETS